ncbi:hypothetical protein LWI28_021446 [Acer negundo]|uniref:non-specific serine/threonine protein kinase n=1 Tax=Acer negundo TaxID=4023 RepID=A0AAD5IMM5_ACENE|nr:hypothetical protein LWI28_021446 [Acer negundo]
MVPVLDAGVDYPSYETIRNLLKSGFDLGWSVLCRDCFAAGDMCLPSTNSKPYTYNCYHNGSNFILALIQLIFSSLVIFLLAVGLISRFIVIPIVFIVFLIYKYRTTRKTVDNVEKFLHIFSKKGTGESFSWEKLHEIALGTARGIEYLHNGCDMRILHFDIKPHNILLDCNFIPKVADFGLAKFYPKERDFVSFWDVLEMAGGRRNSYAEATRSSKVYFPSWVYDQITNGEDLELPDVSEIEVVIARKLCIIGLCCIQVKATDRPSITKVVEMLEGSIDDLQMPPKPFFSSSPQHNSIREIQSDSSTELLESESFEECSYSHQS